MPAGGVLELTSLPALHPNAAILMGFGTSTIVRLSLDPTVVPSGTMVRSVVVEWAARPGGTDVQNVVRDVGWSGVPPLILDSCVKWVATKNVQDITEEAAIGVMALLLNDLEGAEILHVLQIGSGGDYLLGIQGIPPVQAESSGVHVDPLGYESTRRLKDKSTQVLSKCDAGFASVVAFSHSSARDVHCKLHYVSRSGRVSGTIQAVKPKTRSRKKRK